MRVHSDNHDLSFLIDSATLQHLSCSALARLPASARPVLPPAPEGLGRKVSQTVVMPSEVLLLKKKVMETAVTSQPPTSSGPGKPPSPRQQHRPVKTPIGMVVPEKTPQSVRKPPLNIVSSRSDSATLGATDPHEDANNSKWIRRVSVSSCVISSSAAAHAQEQVHTARMCLVMRASLQCAG